MLPVDALVESIWSKRLERGYPVPYVERNMHMHIADKALRDMHIWSRGRFGSWKYEVANQDHSCMLGVDAIDAMLFGGNTEGVEATFNSPSKVNGHYRPYERNVDFQKVMQLARRRPNGSKRNHTKFGPPTRIASLPIWSAVTWHCLEPDGVWPSAFKLLVPDERTKFFAYSYERCGVADTKRPAAEMLFEGLHHLDRIPHGKPRTNASALAHHLRSFYDRLPDRLLFVRPGTTAAHLPQSLRSTLSDAVFAFATVGTGSAPLAQSDMALTPALCALYKTVIGLESSAACPERALILPGWQVLLASAECVRAVPQARWAAIEAAAEAPDSMEAESVERLLLGLLPQIIGESLTPKPELFVATSSDIAVPDTGVTVASGIAAAKGAGLRELDG